MKRERAEKPSPAPGCDHTEVSSQSELRQQSQEASWQFYIDLAEGMFHLGDLEPCAELLGRAVEEATVFGFDDPRLGRSLNSLGILHCHLGNYSNAVRLFRRAAAIFEKHRDSEASRFACALFNLAGACRYQCRYEEAAVAYEQALIIEENAHGSRHRNVAFTLDMLGDVYLMLDRRTAALNSLRRSLAIKERELGPDDWSTAVTLIKLGEYYLAAGRAADAEPVLRRALKIKQKIVGPDDPSLNRDLDRLRGIHIYGPAPSEPDTLFTSSLRMLECALGGANSEMVRLLRDLGRSYATSGQTELRRLLDMVIAAFDAALTIKHPESAVTLEYYTEILRLMGNGTTQPLAAQ